MVERYICNAEWDTYDEKTKRTTHHKCTNKAKDAREDLDIDTIMAACDEIHGQAGELAAIDQMVAVYTSGITKEDLSVNGTGVENLSSLCHGEAAKQQQAIQGHVTGVKGNAISAFNALQTSYNTKAKAECSQIHPNA